MSFTPHMLPLWFLVLSLFLPRICLIVAWLQNNLLFTNYAGISSANRFTVMSLNIPIVPLIFTLLIPRILILILIYQDQGISLWFLLHVLALALAWGGGGRRVYRRRRSAVVVD